MDNSNVDKTLTGKCMDCGKEYMYSPIDKYSVIKSRWVRSARFCGLGCFNKQPKEMRDTITMYELLKHQLDLIDNKRAERKLRQKEKEKNYI
tara:strand:+ start:1066 stop:1341 length:276 start_codon:yes stop_codon:yes gene_type:complete